MSVLILAEKPPQAKAYSEAFPKVEKNDGSIVAFQLEYPKALKEEQKWDWND